MPVRSPATPGVGLRFGFPDGELDREVTLGDVTDRSVRIWVRWPHGPVTAILSAGGSQLARAEIVPDPAHDHVGAATLVIEQPRPGQRFLVSVDDLVRSARFAPTPGTPTAFTFAFGSCHQPFTEPVFGGRLDRHPAAAIYPRIQALLEARDAAFVMLLGDQVYSDAVSRASVRRILAEDRSLTDDDLLETYRHLYRGYFNERGFRSLVGTFPTYLMWDDHDIFDGWGSLLRRTSFDDRLYRAAEGAFREYQHLRNPGGDLGGRAPYAYDVWHGDVGFHVLDLRGERDFESGRILDQSGWARLDAFLAEATERGVPTIFIGASVPVVHGSPTLMRIFEGLRTGTGRDIRDRWVVPTFAAQRRMLVDRLFAWQVAGPKRQVIVLSGDVHVAAAFQVRGRSGGRFSQWVSSALSTPGGIQHVLANRLVTSLVRLGERELRVWRRGLVTGNNVGVVRVEPADGGGHVVTFEVQRYDPGADELVIGLTDVARPS